MFVWLGSTQMTDLKSAALTIQNGHLCLLSGPSFITITARQVYDYVFNSASIIDEKYSVDNTSIPHLSYSKFPIDLNAKITSGSHQVSLSIFGLETDWILDEGKVEEIIDHAIIDDVWYPLDPYALAEIKKILLSNDIPKLGPISLSSYLNLKTDSRFDEYFTDDVTADEIANSVPEDVEARLEVAFKGKLFDYQASGLKWLLTLANENIGGVLADEMGLGKTIQAIALILAKPVPQKGISLIVARATLLENWRREIVKFTEGLSVLVHHGPNRVGNYRILLRNDIIITSYDIVVRDNSMFKMIHWDIIIADEAQDIKNPEAGRTKAIKALTKGAGFSVTGTPVENRLLDLWSLFDFSLPDYLGSKTEFNSLYQDNLDSARQLEPKVKPFILHRKVEDVMQSLPGKIIIPQYIQMDSQTAQMYENIRGNAQGQFAKNSNFTILIKLRQLCCHPLLLTELPKEMIAYSNKYQRLLEIVEEIVWNEEKCIIFSSFTKMLDIITSDIARRFEIYTNKVDGTVSDKKERLEIIDEFTAISGAAVLTLNPTAAGVGLNITAANHVVHYNPEWNPAKEDQASARAYRIGQKRPVTIHRLLYVDTVEEVIDERLDRKRTLAQNTTIGVEGSDDELRDIVRALKCSPVT
ncbi:MAG: DEAD/DEAH box helicase [Bacteroidetes bacterium]|jgi:SNF2 family DNA or RNA helicase|nr:DEAD/DEAH box helicase [Bacteroidota bacterium]